jgi:hypothetical protein
MFERIEVISDTGGAHGSGQVVATPAIPASTGFSPAISG